MSFMVCGGTLYSDRTLCPDNRMIFPQPLALRRCESEISRTVWRSAAYSADRFSRQGGHDQRGKMHRYNYCKSIGCVCVLQWHVLLVWSLYRFSTEPAVTCLFNSCVCLFVTPSPHQRETCCRHPSIGKATHKLRNSPLQTAVCSATWGPFQGLKFVLTIITIACQCQYHSTMLKHLGPISREVSRPLIRLPLRSFWPQWINFCQWVHSLSGNIRKVLQQSDRPFRSSGFAAEWLESQVDSAFRCATLALWTLQSSCCVDITNDRGTEPFTLRQSITCSISFSTHEISLRWHMTPRTQPLEAQSEGGVVDRWPRCNQQRSVAMRGFEWHCDDCSESHLLNLDAGRRCSSDGSKALETVNQMHWGIGSFS